MANSKPPSSLIAFLPRSIAAKKGTKANVKPSLKKQPSCAKASNEDGENVVKTFSYQQRWPSNEEPVCIICERYGEYICDETDEDVCSLECKQKHLTINLKSKQTDKVVSKVPEETQEDFQEYYNQCSEKCVFKSKITKEQAQFFREKLKINISMDKNVPSLLFNFTDFDFHPRLISNLTENNLMRPTVVQMQSIPVGLSHRDMLVSAATTSGKTASFLIPIIQKIHACLGDLPALHPFCKHPIALIIAPTRELCMQIEEQAKALCLSMTNLKTALLIGGAPLPQQLHRLRHKIQLVIGTPGRLNDILSKHEELLSLSQIKMVVLDEVDLMLQMGFQNQVQQILESLPSSPQYMMFSATIPEATEQLASKIMNNAIAISIGLSGSPNQSIEQLVLWVDEKSKKKKLFSIFDDGKHFLPPCLIFVDTKLGADMLSEIISQKYRLRCASIHADKSQDERTNILQSFLTGSYDILVATNVMGRGLDLINVKQVIIFDMAQSLDEYVHQIGRAGSIHQRGFSIVFINNSSKRLFLQLKELFEISKTKLPDEILQSPYIRIQLDKREKREKLDSRDKLKKREIKNEDDENIDAQSLIEILTKKRKRK